MGCASPVGPSWPATSPQDQPRQIPTRLRASVGCSEHPSCINVEAERPCLPPPPPSSSLLPPYVCILFYCDSPSRPCLLLFYHLTPRPTPATHTHTHTLTPHTLHPRAPSLPFSCLPPTTTTCTARRDLDHLPHFPCTAWRCRLPSPSSCSSSPRQGLLALSACGAVSQTARPAPELPRPPKPRRLLES